MNTYKYILILVLIISLSSCKNNKSEEKHNKTEQNISTDLALDHFNIWVVNPEKAKQKLIDIGFNAVPDSLSQVHAGQGTTGRYFYFLNGYLELIFINNQTEFDENNKINNQLDFKERANFKANDASPFSLALKVKDYDIAEISFKKVRYHQDWMGKGESIYAAKNSKTNLNEPSIFVVYPEIESERFSAMSDLDTIPEEYAFVRDFYKHQNGAKNLTEMIITSKDLDLNTETVKAINGIENLTIKSGEDYLMELHFDNDVQGKSFDLRPELPLIIYL